MTGLFHIVVLKVYISYHFNNTNDYIKQTDMSLSNFSSIRSNTYTFNISALSKSICINSIVAYFVTQPYILVNTFDSCYLIQLWAEWILISLICRLSDSIAWYTEEIKSF